MCRNVGVGLPVSQYGGGDPVIQVRFVFAERELVDAPAVIDEFKAIPGDPIILTGIVVVLEGRITQRTVFNAVDRAAQ